MQIGHAPGGASEGGYCVPQAVQMKAGMTAGYTRVAVRATSCWSIRQNVGSRGSGSRVRRRSLSIAETCTNICNRMTYDLESGIAQAGPCEISRRTMTTPFQQGLGSWTQYRSMFDLSESDEVDLHFGPRDRSVS